MSWLKKQSTTSCRWLTRTKVKKRKSLNALSKNTTTTLPNKRSCTRPRLRLTRWRIAYATTVRAGRSHIPSSRFTCRWTKRKNSSSDRSPRVSWAQSITQLRKYSRVPKRFRTGVRTTKRNPTKIYSTNKLPLIRKSSLSFFCLPVQSKAQKKNSTSVKRLSQSLRSNTKRNPRTKCPTSWVNSKTTNHICQPTTCKCMISTNYNWTSRPNLILSQSAQSRSKTSSSNKASTTTS